MNPTILVLFVIVLAVLVILVLLYNSLIGLRNGVDQAASSIDVMLKKRADLIPNLIATVQQYMSHERATLTELTELRTRAISSSAPLEERVAVDAQAAALMSRIVVAAEAYPELKASDNFVLLQRSLNESEEQISAARRAYNAAATALNNAVDMIPTSLLAGPMGITRRALFAATEAERANVDVGALFGANR